MPRDNRPPLIVAYQWSTRLTVIAVEMALPPLAGHWLDGYLHSAFVFTLLGAVFGFIVGMVHLIRLTK